MIKQKKQPLTFTSKKNIRRENEKITGRRSAISKTEDKIDLVKNTAKETGTNLMGKENIEFVQKSKTQIKSALIEKSLN